jgi:uncharacterized RDD family membrane protein YckC
MNNEFSSEDVSREEDFSRSEEAINPTPGVEIEYLNPIRFAGFWMRFWAYLLDLIIIGSVNRILVQPLFRFFDISTVESSLFSPLSIATAVTFYVYFVFMTKFFGQTLGKMVFGLRVIGLEETSLSWKTILFREWIGRFISSTILVGYIIAAFLPKKQGLHDIFSDTTVIHD